MFRPEIKVVDCTLRDGGLINNHKFDDKLVRAVINALNLAGVDYIEVGYRASKTAFATDKYGKCKFCDEDYLKKITEGLELRSKLATMVDVGRTDVDQIPDKKDSVVSMARVACYIKDIDKAIQLVNQMHSKGYETTVNIMAISHALQPDLEEGLAQLAQTPIKAAYIVDSFGALFSEQIHFLVKLYSKYLLPKGIQVGMHAHNNQQLGYANTIEAIRKGANFLDGTIYGIGRAAGNCPVELLLAFLKNPKFNLEPVLEVIEKEFIPLQSKIEWGYNIPYMISGILNQHPKAAMALRSGQDKDKYVQFYRDSLAQDELA